jgi:hypothetical protein
VSGGERRGWRPGAPGEARAAVPGARRAEAERIAASRGLAGRGDARGARRACAGVGRVGVWLSPPAEGRGVCAASRFAELRR